LKLNVERLADGVLLLGLWGANSFTAGAGRPQLNDVQHHQIRRRRRRRTYDFNYCKFVNLIRPTSFKFNLLCEF